MIPKKLLILVAVVVVVVGLGVSLPLVFLLGGSPSTGSPEGTAELYFEAMEDRDAGKLVDTMYIETEAQREAAIDYAENSFGYIKSASVSNLKTEVTSQTDTTATVKATCDYKIEYTDQGHTLGLQDEEATGEIMRFDLQKVDGRWLITNIY